MLHNANLWLCGRQIQMNVNCIMFLFQGQIIKYRKECTKDEDTNIIDVPSSTLRKVNDLHLHNSWIKIYLSSIL